MNNKLITLHNKPTNRPSSLSTPPLPPSIETRRGRISQKTEKNTFSLIKKSQKTPIYDIFEKKGEESLDDFHGAVTGQWPSSTFHKGGGAVAGGHDFVAAHPFRLLFANAAETNERAPGLGE